MPREGCQFSVFLCSPLFWQKRFVTSSLRGFLLKSNHWSGRCGQVRNSDYQGWKVIEVWHSECTQCQVHPGKKSGSISNEASYLTHTTSFYSDPYDFELLDSYSIFGLIFNFLEDRISSTECCSSRYRYRHMLEQTSSLLRRH